MFKHYFEAVENVERGPVISLIIFFVFFIAMLIRLWKMDKGFVKKMENMPLEENDSDILNNKE